MLYWETSRVIRTGDVYLEFELVYPTFSAVGKMTYRITFWRGERFFRDDVGFERMPPNSRTNVLVVNETNRRRT